MKLSILHRLLLVLLAMTALFGEMLLRLWNVERDRWEEVTRQEAEMRRVVFEHASELQSRTLARLTEQLATEVEETTGEADLREKGLSSGAQYLWIVVATGETKGSLHAAAASEVPVLNLDMPSLLQQLSGKGSICFFHRAGAQLIEVVAAPARKLSPGAVLLLGRIVEELYLAELQEMAKMDMRLVSPSETAPAGRNEVRVPLAGLDGNPVAWLAGTISGMNQDQAAGIQKKQWLNLVWVILAFFVIVALLLWLWVGSESLARGGAAKILALSRGNSELGPFASMLAKFRREQERLAEEMRQLQAAEAALREREELFRAIFNQAEQLIALLKPNGEVVKVNSLATRYSGSESSWLGDGVEKAPVWKNRERAARQFQEALENARSGATAQFELDVKDAEGNTAQFSFSLKPVYRDENQTELLLLLLEGNDLTAYRQMEAQVIRAGEEERGRIGLDLHDGLCQELTAADCCLKLSELRLEKGDKAGIADVTAARTMLTNAISGARNLARLLSPLELSQKGLALSLEELAMNTRRMFDIACDVRIGKGVHCEDQEEAKHLYRIVQEAIQNSIRHGQASRIEVDLARNGEGLILEIADNGTGVPPETLHAWNVSQDRGLKTIRYRVRMIGGMMTVTANDPQGLVLTCHIPD